MAELKVEKKKKSPVLWSILGIIVVLIVGWIVYEAFDNDTALDEEYAETEQIDNEGIYTEPDEWEGTGDPWDDESTLAEDWSSDRELWGDQSSATADEEPLEDETMNEKETSNDEDNDTFGMDYSGAVGTEVNNPDMIRQSENFENFLSYAEENNAEDLNRRTTYRGIKKLVMAISSYHSDSIMENWENEVDQLKHQVEMMKDDEMSGRQAYVIKTSFMEIAQTFETLQVKTKADIEEEVSDVREAAEKINDQDMASNQRSEINSFFNEAADVIERLKENSGDKTDS